MGGEIQFDWDQANIEHVAAHGITLEEAEQVMLNLPLEKDRQVRNYEERIQYPGITSSERVLFVVVTNRGKKLGVVTAWSAKEKWVSFGEHINPNGVGMMKDLEIPVFATEAEEAAWWPTQEDAIGEAFEEAAKNGTLKRAHYTLKGATPTTSIRLDPADIELAKKQAESKGLRYQTYLKMIIHEALQRAS